jgi:2-iminobutanoate/2-iminopropanoate deaminase
MALSEIFCEGETLPVGVRVDDLVIGMRVSGRDPKSGALAPDVEHQLRAAYENLERVALAGGATLQSVAQVSIFLSDFDDRPKINEGWTATFTDPDDRPTYKFMPARLPAGELVAMEFFAVPGARRRPISVEGVAHTNPIPLAVAIGRYLFTSRILPYDPATGAPPEGLRAQARHCLDNTDAVLEAAGMSWAQVTQGHAFLSELSERDAVVEPFRARCRAEVPLRVEGYRAGAIEVMLEIMAKGEG